MSTEEALKTVTTAAPLGSECDDMEVEAEDEHVRKVKWLFIDDLNVHLTFFFTPSFQQVQSSYVRESTIVADRMLAQHYLADRPELKR